MTQKLEEPAGAPAPKAGRRRIAELLRTCWRALTASKLNRAAALALAIGCGLGAYAELGGGSESLARGGWTTALTSLSLLAGYTAGFLIRRALRLVLALACAAAGAFVILQVSGVELSLAEVSGFLRSGAGALEGWVESGLPSGAGAGAGLFFGLRRGRRTD